MSRRHRRRWPALAAAGAAVLAAGGCGARVLPLGFGPATTPSAVGRATSPSAAGPTVSAGGGSGARAAGPGGSSTTAAATRTGAGLAGSAASGAVSAGRPAGSGSSGTALSAPASGATGGLTPPRPGTYLERQSGSTTAAGSTTSEPPQGTLVIDAARSDGLQAWHRYVQSGQAPTDSDVRFRGGGSWIESTTEHTPQGDVTCTFRPPIPAPPWPAAAGQTFASTGSCGSNLTITVRGRVAGTRSVALDGTTLTTWVIDSTITASGAFTATGTQVDWYSPALRLPVHESTDLKGKYGVFAFEVRSTSDLVSGRPS